ncbi:hypothetical protein [Pelagibius sp. Alg239-R121]|uniref:hypothetical protein n=1 Tax=Pelagibius sp. Alg239-R121 TaxID=2993448 RepID=UPI0024A67CEF|nr:hypothetical protein [Pelagibius sp. Alg239-R121]
MLTRIIILGVGVFLSGCAADEVFRPDNPSFTKLHGPLSSVSAARTGEQYTRFLALGSEPAQLWSGYASAPDPRALYVVDIAFVFKEVSGLPLTKMRFAPRNHTQDVIDAWPAYAEARIFAYEGGPINLVTVKLPSDRRLGPDGSFESDWTLCLDCVGLTRQGTVKDLARRDRLLAYAHQPSERRPLVKMSMVDRPSQTLLVGGEADALIARVAQKQRDKAVATAQLANGAKRANTPNLPATVQRDKLVIQIADMVEKGTFKSALPLFEKLDALPVPIDPNTNFYWGWSLVESGQTQAGLAKLYRFLNHIVETKGVDSPYYTATLRMISKAEG